MFILTDYTHSNEVNPLILVNLMFFQFWVKIFKSQEAEDSSTFSSVISERFLVWTFPSWQRFIMAFSSFSIWKLWWNMKTGPSHHCPSHKWCLLVRVSGKFWAQNLKIGSVNDIHVYWSFINNFISMFFSFYFSKLTSLRIYDLIYLKNKEECLSVLQSHLPSCDIEILDRVPRHQHGQSEHSQK